MGKYVTMGKLASAIVTGYMMFLYEQIKNGGKKDHGVCFVSPSLISKDGRGEEFVKSDEASRAISVVKKKGQPHHINALYFWGPLGASSARHANNYLLSR